MTADALWPGAPVDEGVPIDLHDDGLLWLINRAVLHPRGFALGHVPGAPAGELVLYGDGTEPWAFDLTAAPVSEDDLFAKVEAALERARQANARSSG